MIGALNWRECLNEIGDGDGGQGAGDGAVEVGDDDIKRVGAIQVGGERICIGGGGGDGVGGEAPLVGQGGGAGGCDG